MEKVTTSVYSSPERREVSAEDRRKLQHGGS
jgi:hypothetical protein